MNAAPSSPVESPASTQRGMRSIRRLLLLALLLVPGAGDLQAQLNVSLNVTARPNPYISAWSTRKETAMFTVIIPPNAQPIQAKFKVEIRLDGDLKARTKLASMPVTTIPAGVSTYYPETLIPMNAVELLGSGKETATKTGMLPAGDYEFCVDLINPADGSSWLTAPVCRFFSITAYQAPILQFPPDAAVLQPQERPIFRWSAVTPTPPGIVRHRLLVFEVLQGQTPTQAFRSNRPILDREVAAMTQLIWPADFLLPGRVNQYVWTVRAMDEQGSPLGEPDGYAEPFSFTVAAAQRRGQETQITGSEQTQRTMTQAPPPGGSQMRQAPAQGNETVDPQNYGAGNPQPAPSSCQPAGVTPPLVNNQTPSTKAANDFVDSVITVGLFPMKVLTASGTSSALAGTGSILVSWLRTPIAVQFSALKVNTDNVVYDGDVVATLDATPDPYSTQWVTNVVGGLPWTHKQVAKLNTWLHAHFNKLVKNLDLNTQVANATNNPVKLPLGLNNLKGYTVAIAEMKFNVTGAQLVGVAAFPIPEHNDTLGFKVSSLLFGPSGPSLSGAKLGLLNDITFTGNVPSGDTYTISFLGANQSGDGTWVDWDCEGFRTLNVDIGIGFPRSWLVPSPDPDPNKKVQARITTTVADWDDWMVSTALPRCTIAGTNGTEIEVVNMAYDHSDTRNPAGILFPKGYQGDTTTTYQGFSIKLASVYLPDKLRTFEDSTRRISISVNDVIINKHGINGNLLAKNVVQYPKGNISSLAASIDTVSITLVNSSVTNAYMRGLITLPVSDTTVTNALDYKALFTNGSGFQFTLDPKGPITAKLFAGGQFVLNKSSNMTLKLDKKASFNLNLNGSFEWADLDIGPVKNVNFKVTFQNMGMAYSDSAGMTYAIGQWSFASPQKSISKFPVTIENIKFVNKPKQGDEILRGALQFTVVVNLSENKIGGRSTLEVVGAIERPPGKKFTAKYISVRVDSIHVHAKTSAVNVEGWVAFMQEHPIMGNGFSGAIKATFNSAQIEVSAMAMFGSTSYNSTSKYRYWYVDAKVILPPPGITFLPGVALYGFGVGAWQRMNVTAVPTLNVAQIENSTQATGATSSGMSFTPNPNIGFGFKLTGVLGTTPDASKCNADVTLSGQFSTSGGMIDIGIQGSLWAMAKLTERSNAPVTGNISLNYNFPTKIFHMTAQVNINKDPITTPGGVNMVAHFDGKTGDWYVKVGEPANRNIIRIAGVNVESYFMMGKTITPPQGFSPAITNGLHSVGIWSFTPDPNAVNAAVGGTGFATGVGVVFDNGTKDRHLFGRVHLRSHVAGGFEVNLSLVRYPPTAVCYGGGTLTGINKWYTQGSVAAFAIFNCVIHVDMKDGTWKDPCLYCCKNNHPNGCDFTLADIKLGAYLMGGFPKPLWLEGQASGSFNFLNGNVTGSFTVDIDYGSKCIPSSPPVTTAAGPAQDAAAEQQMRLIKSITPAHSATGIPLDARPRVLYGFVPNEAFDVIESQGDAAGSTKNRTFQARYTTTWRKFDGQAFVALSHRSIVNELGEYIYCINAPIAPISAAYRPNASGPSGPVAIAGPKAPVTLIDVEPPTPKSPPPPPPPDFGPNLDSATTYRFTVAATLFELKNGQWVPALKRNGQPVTQTQEVQFVTVARPVPPPPPRLINTSTPMQQGSLLRTPDAPGPLGRTISPGMAFSDGGR